MEERRRTPRIEEESEVTITVAANGNEFPEETVVHNRGKDISTSGIRIKSNIVLPIDTLLMMDIKLKYLQQKIGALGKVKWIKIVVEDESYELGVQFVSSSSDARQKLAQYISWKLKKMKTSDPD